MTKQMQTFMYDVGTSFLLSLNPAPFISISLSVPVSLPLPSLNSTHTHTHINSKTANVINLRTHSELRSGATLRMK